MDHPNLLNGEEIPHLMPLKPVAYTSDNVAPSTEHHAVVTTNNITIIYEPVEHVTVSQLNGVHPPEGDAVNMVVQMKMDDLFFNDFLEQCRAFENCKIICFDGFYRTHKLLLSNNDFIRTLLSAEDPGDESVLLLPDFTVAEVQSALKFNAAEQNDLSALLSSCYASLNHHQLDNGEVPTANIDNDVKPEETQVSEATSDVSEAQASRFSKYLTSDGKFQCNLCEKAFNSYRPLHKHMSTYHDTEESSREEKKGNSQKSTKRRRGRPKVKKEFEDFIDDDDYEEEEDTPEEENDEDEDDDIDENEEPRSARERQRRRPKRKKVSEADDSENKGCVCNYCGRSFSIQKYLDSHITNKHPEKSEINSFIEEEDGVYKCVLCQKTFSIARRCRYHLKFKHKIGAKFSCDQCKKMFYYEYDLELHKRFHSSKKNYVCDLCGKGFLLEHVLQTHKHNMHSSREEKEKARKFVCSFCAKGFFSKSALQEHEFLHSEKKNFHCDMCGFSFKQSSGLRAHNNRHHSESGPKPITEEHKEKMRAYMKRYRAMKAGKLPDSINHSFRTPRKPADNPANNTPPVNTVQTKAPILISTTPVVSTTATATEFITPDITLHQIAYKTDYQAGRGGQPPQKLGTRGGVFYI